MHTNNSNPLGLSPERLTRLTRGMERYVEQGQVAGLVSLVWRGGETAAFETFGMADIEAARPMRQDTLFRIYSMTKPITSVAVLMLLEEGRFRLGDPISDYLPAFQEMEVLESLLPGEERRGEEGRVKADRPITIYHLLTHTSGLSYGFGDSPLDRLYQEAFWSLIPADVPGTATGRGPDPVTAAIAGLAPAHRQTLEEAVEAVARLPLAQQPGTRFRYSVATDVLGLLVEKVSGLTLPEFFRQRIFEPLGMPDTAFHVAGEKRDRLSTTYGALGPGGLSVVDAAETSLFHRPPRCPLGGSGLVSTAGDFLRFARMLLGRGELEGARLLSRKTTELMTADHLPAGVSLWDDPAMGFGLGVSVQRRLGGTQSLGSAGTIGWGGAASTDWWADPQEQLIGILMTQLLPAGCPIVQDHRLLTYQSIVD